MANNIFKDTLDAVNLIGKTVVLSTTAVVSTVALTHDAIKDNAIVKSIESKSYAQLCTKQSVIDVKDTVLETLNWDTLLTAEDTKTINSDDMANELFKTMEKGLGRKLTDAEKAEMMNNSNTNTVGSFNQQS